MNHVAKKQQGFTIIELTLAMSFISVLLLGIAMTIIQLGTIYSKGLATKEINQVSRDISSDFRKTLSEVSSISLTNDYVTTPAGGRVCLGTYTYIWNTISAFNTNDPNIVWLQNDPTRLRQLHFVKVPDTARIYCAKTSGGALTYTTIRTVDVPQVQELLPEGDHDLNINRFTISSAPSAYDPTTGQQLYYIEYIIGSGDIATMNTTQTACKNAGQTGADLAYCSVQQFSLVMRAGNRV